MLHQARDKGKSAFPVLHAENQLGVLGAKAEVVMRQPMLVEHAAQDLGNREILVDAAIDAPGQKPQPRCDFRPPEAISAEADSEPREMADMTVQWPALGRIVIAQPHRHRLAEQCPHLGIGCQGQHLDRVDKAARHCLRAVERGQHQNVLAEGVSIASRCPSWVGAAVSSASPEREFPTAIIILRLTVLRCCAPSTDRRWQQETCFVNASTAGASDASSAAVSYYSSLPRTLLRAV